MTMKLGTFLKAYEEALEEGNASLLVGAGLSVPAGFVAWKDLLRDVAADLDLDIDQESDLIGLAQYHVNDRRSRDAIHRKILQEYTKDATPTANHRLIARLPIDTVWTTNYDRLLEDAFKEERKRVDRKIRREDLARTYPKRDVVLYKMHGDVESPDEAVLTKEDYERYNEPQRRQLFSLQLQADLISKTFLFLGLSFTDPNIDYILGRVRSLIGESKRQHYWVVRDANADPKATKRDVTIQKHRIQDLKTYGIQAVLIDDYGEITTKVLDPLVRRANRKSVFLSGSAHEFGPFSEADALAFLRQLGSRVIGDGLNVVCGMGLGVGDAFAMGAIETVYRSQTAHLDQRAVLRPFPQQEADAMRRSTVWTRYREEMLSRAGSAIFVFGNKLSNGATVLASGVREEFEIAAKLGVYPIPIGATGSMAEQLGRILLGDLGKFYGDLADAVKPLLERLCTAGTPANQLVEDTLAVLKVLTTK